MESTYQRPLEKKGLGYFFIKVIIQQLPAKYDHILGDLLH